MVKLASALVEEGCRVSIVSPIYTETMVPLDLEYLRSPGIRGTPFIFARERHPLRYHWTGFRLRLARQQAARNSLPNLSLNELGRATTRAFPELLDLALSHSADMYYGGTATGLSVAAEAARLRGVPFALDLEDFHTGELDASSHSDRTRRLMGEIEHRLLPKAAALTVASDAIRAEYERTYDVRASTINNVFPLPDRVPDVSLARDGRLRLLWVSQVIGPDRGIEAAVNAMAEADVRGTLTLIGNSAGGYASAIQTLASARAPKLDVIHIPPSYQAQKKDHIIDLCRGYDVGLTLEQAGVLNRALCLCNKPFSYLPAGAAVAFTDTPGQRPLAEALGPAALLFRIGDNAAFAAGLRAWSQQPSMLLAAKTAAWEAARSRWHWEHPEERGRALTLVQQALAGS